MILWDCYKAISEVKLFLTRDNPAFFYPNTKSKRNNLRPCHLLFVGVGTAFLVLHKNQKKGCAITMSENTNLNLFAASEQQPVSSPPVQESQPMQQSPEQVNMTQMNSIPAINNIPPTNPLPILVLIYGKINQIIKNPGADKIFAIKNEIEQSKRFNEALESTKTDADRNPICKVTPVVSSSIKSVCNTIERMLIEKIDLLEKC